MIQMYQTNKDTGVPIVFASITDPYKALPDVIKSPTEHSFLTGIQAFPPVDQGFQVLKQFLPNAKKIGVISNSKEANSKAVVDTMQAQAGPLGYTIDLKGINAEADVLAASQALANDKIDVFLAQTDTTVSNAFEVYGVGGSCQQNPHNRAGLWLWHSGCRSQPGRRLFC